MCRNDMYTPPKAVADAGGMTALKKLKDELPKLLTRNTEILDQCERMLTEEKELDEQLDAQYKGRYLNDVCTEMARGVKKYPNFAGKHYKTFGQRGEVGSKNPIFSWMSFKYGTQG